MGFPAWEPADDIGEFADALQTPAPGPFWSLADGYSQMLHMTATTAFVKRAGGGHAP